MYFVDDDELNIYKFVGSKTLGYLVPVKEGLTGLLDSLVSEFYYCGSRLEFGLCANDTE